MNAKLYFQAFIKFAFGALIISALLFVSAGTFNYSKKCPFTFFAAEKNTRYIHPTQPELIFQAMEALS